MPDYIIPRTGKRYRIPQNLAAQFERDMPEAQPLPAPSRDNNSPSVPRLTPSGAPLPLLDFGKEAGEEAVRGFVPGLQQGGDMLYQGMRSAAGETANLFTGSSRDYLKAREVLADLQASGEVDLRDPGLHDAMGAYRRMRSARERYAQGLPGKPEQPSYAEALERAMPSSIDDALKSNGYDRAARSQRTARAGERGFADDLADERAVRHAVDALRQAGGDPAKAYELLGKEAEKETWGDRQGREAGEALANMKPTEGFAAWAGQLVPQMAGTALAVGASLVPWVRPLARPLAMANMAALTASSGGSAMAEARQYGREKGVPVNEAQVWKSGLYNATVEAVTEMIPLGRYMGSVQGFARKALGKSVAGELASNPAARREMADLLERAGKEFGQGFFSRGRVAEWGKDVLAEGGSEFLAEGLQTWAPLVYQSPEDYPTLRQTLENAWEGAKAGAFMGAFLGAGSRTAGYFGQMRRRREQGAVVFADTGEYGVVELTGDSEGGYTALTPEGKAVEVAREDVKDYTRVPYGEFRRGLRGRMERDAAEAAERVRRSSNPETGEYVRVRLKDGREGNLVAGRPGGGTVVVEDDSGERRQVAWEDVVPESVQSVPAGEMARRAHERTLSEAEEAARQAEGNIVPQVGDEFTGPGGRRYRIEQDLSATGGGYLSVPLDEEGSALYTEDMLLSTPEEAAGYLQATRQGEAAQATQGLAEGSAQPQGESYSLSNQVAGNGEMFYQGSNGNIDLVEIPPEVFEQIGYSAAPLRLTPSMINHMIARHGKELGISNEQEAIGFVTDVMRNFDHVRLGNNGALIFSIENARSRTGKRTVTVLLNSSTGEFYGLKTSGYESIKGLQKRPLLWERGANKISSSTDAASASVPTGKSPISGGQSGSASHQSKGLSEGKDSETEAPVQEGNALLRIPVDEQGHPLYEQTEEPQPVGQNRWGKVYQWTLGKAREAARFLRRKQGGYLRGVFHRDDLGDIDLAWGDERGGLKHIIQKHIVEHDDFDSVEEAVDVIGDVLASGTVTQQENGAKVEKGNYRVALRQNEEGKWVVTAYDISRPLEDKKRSASSTLFDQAGTERENGALVSPSASEGEVTENPPTLQADGENLQAPSALSRIPVDEQGQPLYEQADPEAAWDALLEQTEGDEEMALQVASEMVRQREAELKKAGKATALKGTTPAEKIASAKARNAAVSGAQAALESWRAIASTPQRRRAESEAQRRRQLLEASRAQARQAAREGEAAAEAGRIRREALQGVPDMADDTPQDARARGYRRVSGEVVERQQPLISSDRDTALPEANVRFNEELRRYSDGGMDKNEMFHLGQPQGVMRAFLPDLPIVMRQRIVNKGSNRKHDVDVTALQDMPARISDPIFVFKKNDGSVGILTEMKDRNGRNVFVAFDIASTLQDGGKYLEVNNVTTVHGRRVANIIRPILENNTLQWVDKDKALNWFSSASPDVQQEITNQELVSAANIVRNFENPKVDGRNTGAILGKEVQVKFDDSHMPAGNVVLIEAPQLQPSHMGGQRNPLHFLDEAQPKERNDEASIQSARKIAANIRPEEITSSVTAYTGAPTVNSRGEVIQGNNRSAALREMWAGNPEQAAKYRQYLTDHAADFGLAPEDVEGMEQPVLVNMLDVPDEDAITLGQFVAQDTESGGVERIKPRNAVQKMGGGGMRSFAGMLLDSADEEASFSELVDRNGARVLKWMEQKGYITPTQHRSAFDSRGGLTAEAKNDLKGILYQNIFRGGSTHLEEMFARLPAKAQKAILSTAWRDYDSPATDRLAGEVQSSIGAFYALQQYEPFRDARNWKEVRQAVEAWKRQTMMDDATGEAYLPSERFSNFALLLAASYKGQTQGFTQRLFTDIYNLVQGTQEATLFEEPDNTPRTLVQAINEAVRKIEPNFEYDNRNGQRRSNVLAGGSAAGRQGRQGGDGSATSGGRAENQPEQTDGSTRTKRNKGQLRNDGQRQNDLSEISSAERTEMESRIIEWLSDENLSRASGKTRDEIFNEFGNELEPIAYIPAQFIPLVDAGLTDPRIYCGKGYFIDHALRNHAGTGEQMPVENVDASKYLNIQSVLDNPDKIKETYVDGKRTVVFVKRIGRYFAELTQVEDKGKIVLHKSLFNQKKEPYAKLNDIRSKQASPEGGTSSISHADNAAPAISLQSRDDDKSSKPERNLTETPAQERPDLVPTSDNNTSFKDVPKGISSASEDSTNSPAVQGLNEEIASQEAETDTNPTEAQKEAGNYKKGHVRIGRFGITIENPKGSVRRGVDKDGKKWEQTMRNTYGYIRGTEGVDGDHIDVFLADNMDGWEERGVYVVDQYNEDGTFDEHKVMLGFNDKTEALEAYLSNYEKGWENKHKLVMSSVGLPDFEKWINSSHRKTKPFAEYKIAKAELTINNEKANSKTDRIEKLRRSKPIVATGEEYKGRYELDNKSAAGYINKSLKGEYVNKDTGNPIKVTRKGAFKVTRHDAENAAHLKSVALIPQMIENAIFIDEVQNSKGNSGFDSYRYYVVGMNIGGTDYTAKLVVGVKNGETYYDHALTEIEKSNLIDRIDEISSSFTDNEAALVSTYKDKRLISILQGGGEENTNLRDEAQEAFAEIMSESTHDVEISDGEVTETDNTLYAPIKVDRRRTNLSLYQTEPVHSSEEATVGVSYYRDGLTYQEASELSEEYNRHVGRTVCRDGSDELAVEFGSIDEAVRFEEWLNERDAANFPFLHRNLRYVARPIKGDGEGRYTDYGGRRLDLGDNTPEGATMAVFSPNGVIFMGYAAKDRENGVYKIWGKDGKRLKDMPEPDPEADGEAGQKALDEANGKFNKRLEELIANPGQKERVLQLGKAGLFLQAGGIENAEIELEYDKLLRKSKEGYKHEHPFDANDIYDLPKAINSPIAVFKDTNGQGKSSDAVILTELKKEDRNFIVAIRASERKKRGGVVLTVNEITTLFPKDARGIVHWINNQKATNIDKEKALSWIEALRNHHGTGLTDQELVSAANIVRNFENPNTGDENVRFRAVYHGSPADFDHFDHSFMGSGEGAQAYGWGTYVTEVDGIARSYAETLTGRDYAAHINRLAQHVQSRKEFIKTRKADLRRNEDYEKYARAIRKNLCESQKEYKAAERAGEARDMEFYQSLINIANQQLGREYHKHLVDSFWEDINTAQADIDRSNAEIATLKKELRGLKGKRNLYTVEIPDDTGKNYLEWEKPVPGSVDRERLWDFTLGAVLSNGEHDDTETEMLSNDIRDSIDDAETGEDLYKAVALYIGEKEASSLLHDMGFTGIKYPAQYRSGGREDSAKNYVIFNEKDLQITEHVRFRPSGGMWRALRAVEDFNGRYVHGRQVVVDTAGDVEEQLRMHGIEDRETVEELKARASNPDCSGTYEADSDIVFIFAREGADDYAATLFHENTHRAIALGGADVEALYQAIRRGHEKRIDSMAEEYVSHTRKPLDEAKEEIVVAAMTEEYSRGDFSRLLSRMDEAARKELDKILNNIGYDTERESGRGRLDLPDNPRPDRPSEPLRNPRIPGSSEEAQGGSRPQGEGSSLRRAGERAGYTDEELSLASDPAAKALGHSARPSGDTMGRALRAVEDFNGRYVHGRQVVVDTAGDVEEQLRMHGIEDRETVEELKARASNPDCSGTYEADSDIVFIFAREGADDYAATLFHENTHRAIALGGADVEALYAGISSANPQHFAGRIEEYRRDYGGTEAQAKEEAVVAFMEQAMMANDFSKWDTRLSPGQKRELDKILNNIGYDRTKETDHRRVEGKRPGEPERGRIRPGNGQLRDTADAGTEPSAQSEGSSLRRAGERAGYTDEELSLASDPAAKALGHSARTARQRREFARRERERMRRRVEELAAKLHLDNVDIVTDASTLQGARARAKGFFDTRTGRITIVLPNHASAFDAEQTLLHEAVAHYGLRELFGEHFDTFLDNVYQNADAEVRRRITGQAREKGWNFRTATEEYLASLAEDTNFENVNANWWQKIKELFLRMLHKIGFEGFTGVTLSDNELRYILWRSYENLREPGGRRSILGEAADVAKQYELKAGNYAPRPGGGSQVAEEAGISKAERIRKLRESKPVEITGKEIEPSDDLKQYKKNALEYGKKLRGEYTNKDTGETISLTGGNSRGGIREILQHDYKDVEHLQSIAAIPQIIENSIFVEELPNEDFERYPGVNTFSYYVCGLKIGKEDYTVKAVIANQSNGERYYDHKLTHIEKGKLLSIIPTIQKAGMEGNSPISGIKDKRLLSILQGDGEENVLYRDGGPDGPYSSAREEYDARLRTERFTAEESYVDYMASARVLMDVVNKWTGKKTEAWEDFYTAENHLSSKNAADAERFQRECWQPLMEQVQALCRRLEAGGTGHREALNEVDDYLRAKSGLERNAGMGARAVEQAREALGEARRGEAEKAQRETGKSAKGNGEKRKGKSGETARQSVEEAEEALRKALREEQERDFSGLFALMERKGLLPPRGKDEGAAAYKRRATEAARAYTARFEREQGTTEGLWQAVRRTTRHTLRTAYEGGLLSRTAYDRIRGMYGYYVPLRLWEEPTAEDLYSYLSREARPDTAGRTAARARGRTSVAGSPLATMGMMAQDAIHAANRNRMKQLMLNYARRRRGNGLLEVRQCWGRWDEGKQAYVPFFPDVRQGATPQERTRAEEEYERAIRSGRKTADGKPLYRRIHARMEVPYRMLPRDVPEHIVTLYVNGDPVLLQVNGDPRAAQAVNGLTRPDAQAWQERVNRILAANFTTRNPAFLFSNAARDLQTALIKTFMDARPGATARETLHYATMLPRVLHETGQYLFRGKADGKYGKLIGEFFQNGGETGYTVLKEMKDFKKDLLRQTKGGARHAAADALRAAGRAYENFNRQVENFYRVAAYIASRQAGRSIQESVAAAKEVTVNFNRRGAGFKALRRGDTPLQRAIARSGGTLRGLYLFFNVGVQGLRVLLESSFSSPRRALKAASVGAVLYASGYAQPLLNALLASLAGDDNDDRANYYNLPAWERRSNFVFYTGYGRFVKIPLSIENRTVFGLGELCASLLHGQARHEDVPLEALSQVASALPLDFTQNQFWVPDFMAPLAEVIFDEDWTGRPVANRQPWNEHDPEHERIYNNVSPVYVLLSRLANRALGGDGVSRAPGSGAWMNPAVMERLVRGYTGGAGTTVAQALSIVLSPLTGEAVRTRDIPALNRFLTDRADERNRWAGLRDKFHAYRAGAEKTKHDLEGYGERRGTAAEYLEKWRSLKDSPEGRRLAAYERHRKRLESLQERAESLRGKAGYDAVLERYMEAMRQAVEEMERAGE